MAQRSPSVAIWKPSIKKQLLEKNRNVLLCFWNWKLYLYSTASCSPWPWDPQAGVSHISFYGCVLSVNVWFGGETRLWSDQRSGFTNKPGPWRGIKHTPHLLACTLLIYWYPLRLNRVPFMTKQKAAAPPLSPIRTRRISGSHPQAADPRQNSIKQKTKQKQQTHRWMRGVFLLLCLILTFFEGKINAVFYQHIIRFGTVQVSIRMSSVKPDFPPTPSPPFVFSGSITPVRSHFTRSARTHGGWDVANQGTTDFIAGVH